MRKIPIALGMAFLIGNLWSPEARAHFETDQICRPDRVIVDCRTAPHPAGFGYFQCLESKCVWVRQRTKDARPICKVDGDCATGSRCTGIPVDGSLDVGKCSFRRKPTGNGVSCLSQEGCQDGLLCGDLSWTEEGICRPDWMFVEKRNHQDIPLSDHDEFGVLSSIVVNGQGSVPQDIMVHAEIRHPDPRELIVELIDPSGNIATLWGNEGDGTPDLTLDILRIPNPRDDRANGRWSLRVVDTATGNEGTLLHWTLYLSSRWD